MKTKSIFTLIVVLLLSFSAAKAQYYNTSLGLRIGPASGFTVKHFLKETAALEGLVYFRWDGVVITGLYELAGPAFDAQGLNWYFGGGAHIGFWDNNAPPWRDEDDDFVALGGDLILGLEYTFEEIPLNLAIDWKPAFNLIGSQDFWADDVGLSVRFAFK